jgi:hypothetical protein
MTTIKRREIIIEVEKVKVVSNLKKFPIICAVCQTKTEFIYFLEAMTIFEMSETFIFQLADSGLVHLIRNSEDELLVCLPSLILARDNFNNSP